MDLQLVHQLGEKLGILPFYWDIAGVQHFTSLESYLKLFELLGYPANSDAEITTQLQRLNQERCQQICSDVTVCFTHDLPVRLEIVLPESSLAKKFRWHLKCESGEEYQGEFHAPEHELFHLAETDQGKFAFYHLTLNQLSAPGYHLLRIAEVEGELKGECQVIVAPNRCYLPAVPHDKRYWGVSAQVYALRGNKLGAIGTFRELRELAEQVANSGGSAVGVNPLHLLHAPGVAEISPYSASSRIGLNPLLLDIEALASEFGLPSTELQRFCESEQAKTSEFVLYEEYSKRLWNFLEELWAKCLRESNNSWQQESEFRNYCDQLSATEHQVALFNALQEFFFGQNNNTSSWQQWPKEYHHPQAPAVCQFAAHQKNRVQFHLFVQWLVQRQLLGLIQHNKALGLEIGLYGDLALAARSSGAEAWINQDITCFAASIGAPPDELAPQGQNWGLPPWNPRLLRTKRYQPFIEVLRYNMRYYGALRIDHVMSLFRLYWNLPDNAGGAYLRYPLDDLLGIIALESSRSQCIIIGEDLGTVPDEVREAMQRCGMLSYKVLLFMKDQYGNYLAPENYPRESLVVASTHDLPPLAGFWTGSDLNVRRELSLHSEEVLQLMTSRRDNDRQALHRAFAHAGLCTENEALSEAKFCDLAQQFLEKTNSLLYMRQIEDLNNQREQMNLPGTVGEHPNWQRRYP